MVGQTIGNYRIVQKLGEGGMGEVWRGEDVNLKRPVALKFISRDSLDSEEVKARLVREAQAVSLVDHPGVCPVYGTC